MGILERLKAAAGRVTGRGRAEGAPNGTWAAEPQGSPRANRQGGPATGGGDGERNVGG